LKDVLEPADNSGMARQRSAQEIQQLLEKYRASGLTQSEYCRQTGVVLSSLGRYLRRNRSEQRLVKVKLEAPSEPGVGFVLMLAITVAMIAACLFGVLMPTALRALKADPKIAAGPIVLALTDLATLLCYFNMAGILLG